MIVSIAVLTPSISSSTTAPVKETLHPTYAGFSVFLAMILATLVAKSTLFGIEQSAVLRLSGGLSRCLGVSR